MEKNLADYKTIGIVAHSYEGGTLSLITACREGGKLLGPHMHPNLVLSAIPMGLSMEAWETDDYHTLGTHHAKGIDQVFKSGADFFYCPDNTSHIVLEKIIGDQSIPGLHIADVVCAEIKKKGWKKIGLLGTKWTMTGPVYPRVFEKHGFKKIIPSQDIRQKINAAIFDELCQGIIKEETTNVFIECIKDLKTEGAECVILGCTEIPLIINEQNSPLPVLDSTRLQAKYAVELAISDWQITSRGWIQLDNH
ncbi:MAG: amino acid racemase [Saprospiraceae bacterium]|nr:amino acid racemase [Saprospiraceae bacterium]